MKVFIKTLSNYIPSKQDSNSFTKVFIEIIILTAILLFAVFCTDLFVNAYIFSFLSM